MKNSEIAKTLLELANVYGTMPDTGSVSLTNKKISESTGEVIKEIVGPVDIDSSLPIPSLKIYATTKDQVIALIRAIGGKFVKRIGWSGDTMYYDSQRLPGVSVWIYRNLVCRRVTPEYECEPLFSPEEEAEILTEAKA